MAPNVATMYETQQIVPHPNGICVFGSAQVRAAPDLAELSLSVTRLAPTPAEAFRATTEAATKVSAFLATAGLRASAVSTSQATLRQAYRDRGPERESLGYRASITFAIVVDDLQRVEHVLTGAIDAGADVLERLAFRTRRIGELRAEARRRAIDAARRKAALYADAAGVGLGPVLHVEDRDPEVLARESAYHTPPERPHDDEGALDGPTPPGSVAVAAAATVLFAILPRP